MAGVHGNGQITVPTKDEPFQRIEVITGVARRRCWTEADKAMIVAETLVPGTNAAAVARRHGIHPHQLYDWRRALRRMPAGAGEEGKDAAPAFVPIAVAAEPPSGAGGTIEVVVGSVTVRVGGDVDAAALRRVLDVIRSLA